MREDRLNQPDALRQKKASQVIGLLRANEGFSLIEVLVVAMVIVVLILTIYIGAIYAEKQVLQNYRHRVATFMISGEIEKQYVLFMKEGYFRPFSGRKASIEETKEVKLEGTMSLQAGRDLEYYVTRRYPMNYVIGEIRWLDPYTKKQNSIKIREDFYDVEGKVNN